MQERSIIERIEVLEIKVDALDTLPARVTAVELQIVQLREEMRAEFFAVRTEFRLDIRREVTTLREELRTEIRTGDEETRRYMRVLHEEVLSRLARRRI